MKTEVSPPRHALFPIAHLAPTRYHYHPMTHLFIFAQATAANQNGGSIWQMMAPMLVLFALFYFMLIRPQQRRQKEHAQLVSALQTGDKVVTSSGIHGIIANVKDHTVIVKIAENVKIEIDRGAIGTVTRDTEATK